MQLGEALGFVGDFLGHKEGKKQRRQEAAERGADRALQREMAQMGVRWRVADAKAAGLHPLSVLGAITPGGSPTASVGGDQGESFRRMGQSLKDLARSPEEKLLKAAALRQAEAAAEKDEALAAYWRSESARNAAGPATFPSSAVTWPFGSAPGQHPLQAGAVELQADPQVSRHPSESDVSAGAPPAWRRYETAPGEFMYLPYGSNMSESLQSIPWWMLPKVIRRNWRGDGRRRRLPPAIVGGPQP